MEVTHHKDHKNFKKYQQLKPVDVLEAPWHDLEQDAHIGRAFTVRRLQPLGQR
jgi:hypothetical protein